MNYRKTHYFLTRLATKDAGSYMTTGQSPQAKPLSVEELLAAHLSELQAAAYTTPIVAERPPSQPPEVELTPLRVRLERLLSDLPELTKRAGIPLHAITERLRGRVCARAHPGEVGTALRELGWQRRRCWRAHQGGFRALWYPPASASDQGRS